MTVKSLLGKMKFLLPDKMFLSVVFYERMQYKINWKDPKTFNEKLQWLKIYDRNPEYTTMVDKARVKDYVAERIGAQYVIPTLGVWSSYDEIDFDKLPDQFVLKCTHDSGSAVICTDKSAIDHQALRAFFHERLKRNFYLYGREWAYKNVEHKIIAEQYLSDPNYAVLPDYKLLCFNGKVKCSFVYTDRRTENGLHMNCYDRDWNPMPFERHYPRSANEIKKPDSYELMVELAERLSEGTTFERIDFYEIDGRIYFGEITMYPGNGMEEFTPFCYDELLGSWIRLPEKR